MRRGRSRTTRLGVVTAAALLVAVVAACTSDDSSAPDTTAPPSTTSTAPPGAPSLVVIGDSVAAGEGIGYGYRYQYDASNPSSSRWVGGTKDPRWQPPYQLCHQDDQAYGEVVAQRLDLALSKFACTGATYLNGITAEQTADGQTYRPAQFGDWATGTQLNTAYDRAEPDVVVLTFGADDVRFSSIVRYCVSGYTVADSALVAALAAATDPVGAIAGALASRVPKLAAALLAGDFSFRNDTASSYCTAANPGAPVEELFWKPVRSGAIAAHFRAIVEAIQARGRDPRFGNGTVPKIVFTTYPRPLPAGLDGDCWDVYPLSSAEQRYLQSLQDTLQATLVDAVKDMDGVTIADASSADDGHAWCSKDPWVYGLSTIWFDDVSSMAPFHPTPQGQQAIAGVVAPAVQQALG